MKLFVRFFCIVLVLFLVCTCVSAEGGGIETTAKSVILIDSATGEVLYEKNPDERLPIASVTKVMTMLLCMEAINSGKITMEDTVTASEYACSMGGSQVYLEPGEQMPVSDMIKAIAVASGNDASVAMAEHIMGSEQGFVAAMNTRAKELGMENTNFINCNGLDEDGHYSSARDVAIMSKELIKHEQILPYLKIWMDTLRNGEFGLSNTNKLIRFYPDAIGIKTGSTGKAKYCVSGAATRNGLTLIAVVLGAETTTDRFETAKALLNYGFANYSISEPVKKGEEIANLMVLKGEADSVKVITGNGYVKLVPKGADGGYERKVILPENVTAPVNKGDKAGEIVLLKDGAEVAKVPLFYAETVPRLSFGKIFVNMLKYWGYNNN